VLNPLKRLVALRARYAVDWQFLSRPRHHTHSYRSTMLHGRNQPCAGTWQNWTLYSGGRSGLLCVDQIEAIAITITKRIIRMAHQKWCWPGISHSRDQFSPTLTRMATADTIIRVQQSVT
jgi:hypothetical protein